MPTLVEVNECVVEIDADAELEEECVGECVSLAVVVLLSVPLPELEYDTDVVLLSDTVRDGNPVAVTEPRVEVNEGVPVAVGELTAETVADSDADAEAERLTEEVPECVLVAVTEPRVEVNEGVLVEEIVADSEPDIEAELEEELLLVLV